MSVLLKDIRDKGFEPERLKVKRISYTSPETKDFTICGLPSSVYVDRLARKHQFFFNPIEDIGDAYMRRIKDLVIIYSPIPYDEESLLVFLHELGHKQSNQVREYTIGFLNTGSSVGSVISEILAWENAFSRFCKYGFKLTDELWDFSMKALSSYVIYIYPKDSKFIIGLIEKLAEKYGKTYTPPLDFEVRKIEGIRYISYGKSEQGKVKKDKKHKMPYWANDWRK